MLFRSGLVETMAATNLTGGVDPGIQMSISTAALALKVMWLTKEQHDENA